MKARIKVSLTDLDDAVAYVSINHIVGIISYEEVTHINVVGSDQAIKVTETVEEVLALVDAS